MKINLKKLSNSEIEEVLNEIFNLKYKYTVILVKETKIYQYTNKKIIIYNFITTNKKYYEKVINRGIIIVNINFDISYDMYKHGKINNVILLGALLKESNTENQLKIINQMNIKNKKILEKIIKKDKVNYPL